MLKIIILNFHANKQILELLFCFVFYLFFLLLVQPFNHQTVKMRKVNSRPQVGVPVKFGFKTRNSGLWWTKVSSSGLLVFFSQWAAPERKNKNMSPKVKTERNVLKIVKREEQGHSTQQGWGEKLHICIQTMVVLRNHTGRQPVDGGDGGHGGPEPVGSLSSTRRLPIVGLKSCFCLFFFFFGGGATSIRCKMQQCSRRQDPSKTSVISDTLCFCCCREHHVQVLGTSSWVVHIQSENWFFFLLVCVWNSRLSLHSGSCRRQPLEGSRGRQRFSQRPPPLSRHTLAWEILRPPVTIGETMFHVTEPST